MTNVENLFFRLQKNTQKIFNKQKKIHLFKCNYCLKKDNFNFNEIVTTIVNLKKTIILYLQRPGNM